MTRTDKIDFLKFLLSKVIFGPILVPKFQKQSPPKVT